MRFVIHELWGRLGPGTSNTPDGVTVTVHDSEMLYATVGQFRSEDEWQGDGRAKMISGARDNAAQLAAHLEAECSDAS